MSNPGFGPRGQVSQAAAVSFEFRPTGATEFTVMQVPFGLGWQARSAMHFAGNPKGLRPLGEPFEGPN